MIKFIFQIKVKDTDNSDFNNIKKGESIFFVLVLI